MLRCESLTQTYLSGGRELTVLKDITFDVADSAFLAIVGPSGSGKSTLLGLLAGLDRPRSGRVILDGDDLGGLGEDERARLRACKVGFVFQSFHLIPTLTARENVQVPLELRGRQFPRLPSAAFPWRSAAGSNPDAVPGMKQGAKRGRQFEEDPRVRADELLERVGLKDRGHHYPAQLSGGEQQRVALARAFSHRPRILFADEPTGNLDAATGATVIDLMAGLNRELGTTLILVTHDNDLAARARRIIRLSDGAIVSDSAGPGGNDEGHPQRSEPT